MSKSDESKTAQSKSKGKGKKGNNEKGKRKQITVFGAGFQIIESEPLYVKKLVLLTDAIYGKNPPAEHKGMHFVYKVSAWDDDEKVYKLTYQNRMIKSDGIEWEFQDGGRASIHDVKFATVKAGEKLYDKALGRVAANKKKDISVAGATLKAAGDGGGKRKAVDFTDLDEAASNDNDKGWRSEDVTNVSLCGTHDLRQHL